MQMAAWTAAAAGHTHKKTLQFIYSVACTAKKKKPKQKASKSQWNKNVAYFSAATTCTGHTERKTGGWWEEWGVINMLKLH